MGDIFTSAKAYEQLLDIEYYIILGKKNKTLEFCIFFDENHFFPQIDKDYSLGQTNWTLLYKKKIQKSTGQETVLYDKLVRETIHK